MSSDPFPCLQWDGSGYVRIVNNYIEINNYSCDQTMKLTFHVVQINKAKRKRNKKLIVFEIKMAYLLKNIIEWKEWIWRCAK